MELAQPSIGDAIQQLAQQGEQEVIVVPYFLSPGRHITQDIPALVDTARQANPDITCSIADPIGEQSCRLPCILASYAACCHRLATCSGIWPEKLQGQTQPDMQHLM